MFKQRKVKILAYIVTIALVVQYFSQTGLVFVSANEILGAAPISNEISSTEDGNLAAPICVNPDTEEMNIPAEPMDITGDSINMQNEYSADNPEVIDWSSIAPISMMETQSTPLYLGEAPVGEEDNDHTIEENSIEIELFEKQNGELTSKRLVQGMEVSLYSSVNNGDYSKVANVDTLITDANGKVTFVNLGPEEPEDSDDSVSPSPSDEIKYQARVTIPSSLSDVYKYQHGTSYEGFEVTLGESTSHNIFMLHKAVGETAKVFITVNSIDGVATENLSLQLSADGFSTVVMDVASDLYDNATEKRRTGIDLTGSLYYGVSYNISLVKPDEDGLWLADVAAFNADASTKTVINDWWYTYQKDIDLNYYMQLNLLLPNGSDKASALNFDIYKLSTMEKLNSSVLTTNEVGAFEFSSGLGFVLEGYEDYVLKFHDEQYKDVLFHTEVKGTINETLEYETRQYKLSVSLPDGNGKVWSAEVQNKNDENDKFTLSNEFGKKSKADLRVMSEYEVTVTSDGYQTKHAEIRPVLSDNITNTTVQYIMKENEIRLSLVNAEDNSAVSPKNSTTNENLISADLFINGNKEMDIYFAAESDYYVFRSSKIKNSENLKVKINDEQDKYITKTAKREVTNIISDELQTENLTNEIKVYETTPFTIYVTDSYTIDDQRPVESVEVIVEHENNEFEMQKGITEFHDGTCFTTFMLLEGEEYKVSLNKEDNASVYISWTQKKNFVYQDYQGEYFTPSIDNNQLTIKLQNVEKEVHFLNTANDSEILNVKYYNGNKYEYDNSLRYYEWEHSINTISREPFMTKSPYMIFFVSTPRNGKKCLTVGNKEGFTGRWMKSSKGKEYINDESTTESDLRYELTFNGDTDRIDFRIDVSDSKYVINLTDDILRNSVENANNEEYYIENGYKIPISIISNDADSSNLEYEVNWNTADVKGGSLISHDTGINGLLIVKDISYFGEEEQMDLFLAVKTSQSSIPSTYTIPASKIHRPTIINGEDITMDGSALEEVPFTVSENNDYDVFYAKDAITLHTVTTNQYTSHAYNQYRYISVLNESGIEGLSSAEWIPMTDTEVTLSDAELNENKFIYLQMRRVNEENQSECTSDPMYIVRDDTIAPRIIQTIFTQGKTVKQEGHEDVYVNRPSSIGFNIEDNTLLNMGITCSLMGYDSKGNKKQYALDNTLDSYESLKPFEKESINSVLLDLGSSSSVISYDFNESTDNTSHFTDPAVAAVYTFTANAIDRLDKPSSLTQTVYYDTTVPTVDITNTTQKNGINWYGAKENEKADFTLGIKVNDLTNEYFKYAVAVYKQRVGVALPTDNMNYESVLEVMNDQLEKKWLIETGKDTYQYIIPEDENGAYEYYVVAVDNCNNISIPTKPEKVYIDRVAPDKDDIFISFHGDIEQPKVDDLTFEDRIFDVMKGSLPRQHYRNTMTVNIYTRDAVSQIAGVKLVYGDFTYEGAVSGTTTINDNEYSVCSFVLPGPTEKKEISALITSIAVSDVAGNSTILTSGTEALQIEHPNDLIIFDSVSPSLFITYPEGAQKEDNVLYYKNDIIVSAAISEFYFYEEDINSNAKFTRDNWTLENGVYKNLIQLACTEAEDETGFYLAYADRSENQMVGSDELNVKDGKYTSPVVVIDKLAPRISLSLSSNDVYAEDAVCLAANSSTVYYNDAVTMGVSVEDRYFTEKGVKVNLVQTDVNGVVLQKEEYVPDAGVWTKDGIRQSMVIPCTEDGHYVITVTVTDKAGNQSVSASNFTIDKVKPDADISDIGTDISITRKNVGAAAKLVRFISFGHFAKEQLNVKIKTHDITSGVKEITYGIQNFGDTAWTDTTVPVSYEGTGYDTAFIAFDLDPDFKGFIRAYARDYSGLGAGEFFPEIRCIVSESQGKHDKTSQLTINPTTQPNGNGFYNTNVQVAYAMSDTTSGISSLQYAAGAKYTNSKDYASMTQGNAINLVNSYSDTVTVNASENNRNDVLLSASYTDNAGYTETLQKRIKIDVTAPVINVSYDNNDAVNGTYFNKPRTATISVAERNFNPADAHINVTSTGELPGISGWTHQGAGGCGGTADSHTDGCVYVATVTFAKDADYTLGFSCTDLAGNSAAYQNTDAFTVDITNPEVSVTYDNNDAANGNFFKAGRTGKITITEHNFNSSMVNCQISATDGTTTAPTVSGWSSNGDVHTATVTYSTDGTYEFNITCKDQADNSMTPFEAHRFIIDQTAPELSVSGVTNHSANSGEVIPVITFSDRNADAGALTCSLTGSNTGVHKIENAVEKTNNGFVLNLGNVEPVKENDDLYSLKASVADKAGNVTETEIKYSLNRYGSVFILDDRTLEAENKYYLNASPDVVVTEYNVDELTKHEVTVGRDSSIVTLKEGMDYEFSKLDDDKWNAYRYSVPSDNFKEEGIYTVALYSEDNAKNMNDLKAEKNQNNNSNRDIAFAVDKTAPSLIVTGVEDRGSYTQEAINIIIDCRDNLCLAGADATLNTQETKHEASEFEANDGRINVSAAASNDWQDLKVVAYDAAGNRSEEMSMRFLLTSNLFIQWFRNTPLFAGTLGGTAVVGFGIMQLIIALKRKRVKVRA